MVTDHFDLEGEDLDLEEDGDPKSETEAEAAQNLAQQLRMIIVPLASTGCPWYVY